MAHSGQIKSLTTQLIEQLRGQKTPSRLGFDDFVVLLAVGQSVTGTKMVLYDSDLVSDFLVNHQQVSHDFRVQPSAVQRYFDALHSQSLVQTYQEGKRYALHPAVQEAVLDDRIALQSETVDDALFDSFKDYVYEHFKYR